MAEWHLTTPVVLIIFNRPDTTQRVFESIRQMHPPKMLIIADGPRADMPNEVYQCKAARKIIERIDWPCEVLTNYAEKNLGCKLRVSSGLDWVFENVEEAIILEDDCVPHPTFFRFCEELLNKYRDDNRIGIISGNNFQFGKKRTQYSYYYSRYTHIWGWASWQRVWQNYDVRMNMWPEIRRDNWVNDILGKNEYATIWTNIFDQVYGNNIDTWDFQLTFACWINNYVNIIPNANLVTNIGYGQNATHTTEIDKRSNMGTGQMHYPLKHPPYIINDTISDDHAMKLIYAKKKLLKRLIAKIKKKIVNHRFLK